jgi:tetratricopeptide (TPR) repeat protein
MIHLLICSLLVSVPGYLLSDLPTEQIRKMLESGHYKKVIKTIDLEKDKSGDSYALLAEAYYKDQEHAKAYEAFLKALDKTPKKDNASHQMGKDEALLYDEALKTYLDTTARDSVTTSLKIRDQYAGIWRLHPEYAELGYLVAIAYANLGEYADFFEVFYRSYKKIPDHFLAYKTQGVLHLKLYDRGKTLADKERERAQVLFYFNKAKELYPQDYSLYRMEIAFSQDKERILETNLKEIIDRDIVIPRADLSFYIDQLFAYGKNELATEFLAKARKWYPYSRTLDAADDIIKSKKDAK